MRGIVLALPVAASLLGPSMAASVEECAGIPGAEERLACFDAAVNAPSAEQHPAGGEPTPLGTRNHLEIKGWWIDREKSPMDGSESVMVGLNSDETESGGWPSASLVLRCVENRSSLSIHLATKKIFTSEPLGEWGVGSGKVTEAWLMMFSDYTAAGMNAKESITAMKAIESAETFAFRIIDRRGESSTFTFNTAGGKEAVAPIRERCGW